MVLIECRNLLMKNHLIIRDSIFFQREFVLFLTCSLSRRQATVIQLDTRALPGSISSVLRADLFLVGPLSI